MSIDVRGVTHRFGAHKAVDGVDLTVEPGELVALLGPSGSGKTTLLRIIGGLESPDEGRVFLDGVDATAQPAQRRRVGFVFQHYALFRHLSIFENVAFGLRVQPRASRPSEAEIRTQVHDLLALVQLDGLAKRYPAQLSGGQRQRVALARALATHPDALLLDEPLTSLDAETAADVRALLHDQLAATRTTAIVATHDAVDAVSLATRLVVLEDGRVTQSGPVRDVLAAPATRFAAAVAGLNRVEGSVQAGRWAQGALALDAGEEASARLGGSGVAAVFRPSSVEIADVLGETWTAALRLAPAARPGEWLARVTRLEQTPAGVRVRTAEPEVAVDMTAGRAAELGLAPGVPVRLRLAASDVRFVAAP